MAAAVQTLKSVRYFCAGEQVTDMITYVEYKRNYQMVLLTHRRVLYTERKFWRCLLHSNINFSTLSETFKEIYLQRDKTKDMYKSMLVQYSNSVEVRCLRGGKTD